MEQWKDIPGYEGIYQASSLGRIRSLDRIATQKSRSGGTRDRFIKGTVLKPWRVAGDYLAVGLSRTKKCSVHRLVCMAFHGPPVPPRTDVAHSDGTRDNNRPDNLRWATRSENTFDAVMHGTSKLNQYRTDGYKAKHNLPPTKRGEFHPRAKLSANKGQLILAGYAAGRTMREMAEEFGVGKSTIFRVIRRGLWTT